MIKDKVSVILPVYNSEKTIEKTINSVLNQSYQNFELIIINDGSTDNTDIICSSYINDSKVRYIYNKNQGVSKSRNIGLDLAEGEYICFIDSDDLYEKNYLNEMIKRITDNNCDWDICGYQCFESSNKNFSIEKGFITEEKNVVIEFLQSKLLFNQLWNKIYKNKIIQENYIRFEENLNLGEDAIFNINYLKYCNKIECFNLCLYKYRITNNGLGFKYRKNAGELKLKIFRAIFLLYEENNYETSYIEKNLLKQYISWIANIVDNRNKEDSYKEKYFLVKRIFKNDNFKNDLLFISDWKIRLIFKSFKITSIALFLGLFANKFDKFNKKKLL
ncbi:glycosyl transferase [Turicibacter faecis]|uniref:Glycosyl transferase n=1 Tax=Turicibacter faecis TaxID=2963365 RepID=A0ABM8IK29_9FIRM|nr:glycosyl transferase [Turicibacter sp. TC023]